MTKINIYEGNSFRVSRTFVTSTTLPAYDVEFTIKQNKYDNSAVTTVKGNVVHNGVTFDVPAIDTMKKGVYYFEITGETATQTTTLEQDRLFVRESIVYVS